MTSFSLLNIEMARESRLPFLSMRKWSFCPILSLVRVLVLSVLSSMKSVFCGRFRVLKMVERLSSSFTV